MGNHLLRLPLLVAFLFLASCGDRGQAHRKKGKQE
jgi:hypothetical protein